MEIGVFIASGNTADIYLSKYGNYAVKLFNAGFGIEIAQGEANKQKVVCACATDFRVPKIADVLHIDHQPAIIMEYISGKDLAEKMLSGNNLEQLMYAFVVLQQKVHQTKVPQGVFPLSTDKLSHQIKQAPCLMQTQKNTLLKNLSKMDTSHTLCHGDFHPKNVLCHKGDYIIIDWLDASMGNALADICRSYLIFLQSVPEIAPLYLKIYCKESGVLEEDIHEWMPLIPAARLSESLPESEQKQLLQILSGYLI